MGVLRTTLIWDATIACCVGRLEKRGTLGLGPAASMSLDAWEALAVLLPSRLRSCCKHGRRVLRGVKGRKQNELHLSLQAYGREVLLAMSSKMPCQGILLVSRVSVLISRSMA